MGQATFSVRMDEGLKVEFEELCNQFGMNMATAINVFARAVVRERKIPFDIVAENSVTRKELLNVFNALRSEATKTDLSDMSMEDIDLEIKKARNGN